MSWETMTGEEIGAVYRRTLDAYVDAAMRAEARENERLIRRALELSSWTFWQRVHTVRVQHEPLGPWFLGVASRWDPPGVSYRSWTDPGRQDGPTPRPSRTRFASRLLRRLRRRRAR